MTSQDVGAEPVAPMSVRTDGIHHLMLRVTDLHRAKSFYTDVLGFAEVLQTEELLLLKVHTTLLGLCGGAPETRSNERFSPFRVGLDHLALAVPSANALLGLQRQLDVAGVPNNGIEADPVLGGTYVAFFDPDGIAWELYVLPGERR